jgi:hypothetical protein
MTKKQKADLIIFIKSVLKSSGWVEDRWGNFKKTVSVKDKSEDFRVKFQKTSIRYEVKCHGWLNLASDYYKNVKICDKEDVKYFQIKHKVFLTK